MPYWSLNCTSDGTVIDGASLPACADGVTASESGQGTEALFRYAVEARVHPDEKPLRIYVNNFARGNPQLPVSHADLFELYKETASNQSKSTEDEPLLYSVSDVQIYFQTDATCPCGLTTTTTARYIPVGDGDIPTTVVKDFQHGLEARNGFQHGREAWELRAKL